MDQVRLETGDGAVVNTAVNLRVLWKKRHILSVSAIVTLPNTLLRGLSFDELFNDNNIALFNCWVV